MHLDPCATLQIVVWLYRKTCAKNKLRLKNKVLRHICVFPTFNLKKIISIEMVDLACKIPVDGLSCIHLD